MTRHSGHHDSLFLNDLTPDLRQLEDSLAEMAARERLPEGLTERVYAASVKGLPTRLRLVGTTGSPRVAIPLHRTRWAQVAMAAGIGLAFVVGAWFLAGPPSSSVHDPSGLIADAGEVQAPVVTRVAHHPRQLTPEAAEYLWDVVGADASLVGVLESPGMMFAMDDSHWYEDHEL